MSGLTDTQALLVESGERLARDLAGRDVDDAALWAQLCELGWPGVLVPEALGGFGGDAVEAFLLGQAHGAGVPHGAFLASAVLCATILRGLEGEAAEDGLSALAEGRSRYALAHFERGLAEAPRAVIARPDGDGFVLAGEKVAVLGGAQAGVLIVSAADETGAPALFEIAADTPGVSLEARRLIDGRPAAWLRLDDARAPASARLATGEAARRLLDAAQAMGTAFLVGEALAALDGALAASLEHLRTRRQFGQPLANFQVLRHRAADMFMIVEEIRALCLETAQALARRDPGAGDLLRAAKIHIGTAGVWVAEQAIQLHGAMGVTEEGPVGGALKRLITLDALFGNAEHHLARIAAEPFAAA